MNRFLYHAAFSVGLAAVCWMGIGHIGSNPLALAMTVLIGAFYLMGAIELHRFQQATSSLSQALMGMPDPLPSLGPWLIQVHPSLQNAVRLRIEGERLGLPGPAMTPYLAGLLVLLGMLGTFLGMVVTLNGTGIALESATDLQAIRASLAAPVKGLGLAFGTSVAGVAASAMLGLMSTLARRERLHTAQMLDTKIATTLRVFSLAHQREESFKLLQRQAEAMPVLVDRLQAMMAQMERQSHDLSARLMDNQDAFYAKAEAAYAGLASSVGQSLKESLTDSARIAGATIQPVVEATMAGIARETTSLQGAVASTVQRQLDGLSTRFDATTSAVADIWKTALAQHELTSQHLSKDLRTSLDHFAETFEQRSASLVNAVAETHEGQSRQTHQALAAAGASFEQHAAALLRTVDKVHVDLQAQMASRDQQRLAAWTQALESMAVSLQKEWQQAGTQTLGQQQQICKTLEQTARDMATQAQTHASHTIAEISRLVQAAAEAPRAAAEVIAELREKLSDSMARDNSILEERSRIVETLGTLLDALNHASSEQRGAIDTLVASSAALLERVSTRFTEKVDTQTEKMADVAAQITGSAVEVSSLGEAFGFAVQLFNQSNDKLMAHLQRIEASLSKSITRSDEQLAYYVAQAREIIDLSIMSQKQIVEDLQQLSSARAPLLSEA